MRQPLHQLEESKTIFVTVGTTLFDPLIENVTSPTFLNKITQYGFDCIVIQYGKGQTPKLAKDCDEESSVGGAYSGEYTTTTAQKSLVQWEVYRFKPSLENDMSNADLIISHAGAGSVMEGLEHCRTRNSKIQPSTTNNDDDDDNKNNNVSLLSIIPERLKKLVVVINDKLMNNHQCELAYALEKRKFLFVLPQPEDLLKEERVDAIVKNFQPRSFEGGNDHSFGILVDDFMGYNMKKSN